MKRRRESLAIILGTLLIGPGLNCFSQTAANSPIKVLSAKRAQSYTSGQELTPTNPKEDVVLVLEIGGISPDEFRKIEKKKLYLMAGERRCVFQVASSGIIDGKPQIKLATIVPRQGLDFKLFAGDYPPRTFKAEEKVYDQLD